MILNINIKVTHKYINRIFFSSFMFLCVFVTLWQFVLQTFAQSFIEVKKIKQNTNDYSEFGAAYFEDGIAFCSNTRNNIIISRQNAERKSFYNVYFFSLKDESKKKNLNFLSSIVNKPFNDGPLSTNGSILIFSRNYEIPKDEKKDTTKVGLFICNKVDSIWTEPVPFCYNDVKYNLGHPSVNQQGNTLYFSSDKSGGFGQFDIYVSYLKNGNWTIPENLGKEINTSGSELFPFIFQDNRLYFATNYFDSTHTFDIYYSDFQENKWNKPIRMDEPINSKANDFGFICDNTTENGFFTSDRKGTDDIFKFFSTLPAFETCDSMLEKNYCFHFVEGKTVDLDTIPVIYEWDFGDSTKEKTFEADHCFPGPGSYNVSLNMIDTITGDIYKMIASYLLSVDDPIGPYIVCAEKAKVNSAIEFDASQTNMSENKIDQYVWLFSDDKKFVGQKIIRSFEKPGVYRINLGVTFDKDESGTYQKKCVFKDIVVE